MDARELTQELNLKTMVSLQGLIQDEQRGLITKAQVATGIRGIFDAVGGLISQDTFDVLSAAVTQYRGFRGVEIMPSKSPQGTLQAVVRFCGSGAIAHFQTGSVVRVPEYSEDTDEQAREVATKLHQRLIEEHRTW